MEKRHTGDLLELAVKVGEELLQRGLVTKNKGLKWIYGHETEIRHEGLARGNAGIVLFFSDLFQCTSDSEYLDVIHCSTIPLIEALGRLPFRHGFYDGTGGITYALLKAAFVLDNSELIDQSLDHFKTAYYHNHTSPCNRFNLRSGISGNILGLLHLFRETKDEEILEMIEKEVQHLIDSVQVDTNGGYFWECNIFQAIKGLCGFAVGNSGIGYLFVELGKLFENQAFLFLARQAFLYEDNHFNSDIENWPDFVQADLYSKYSQKPSLLKKAEEYYSTYKQNYFYKYQDNMGWSRGTVGIGLSRIRAHQLLPNDPNIQLSIKSSLKKINSFTHSFEKFPAHVTNSLSDGVMGWIHLLNIGMSLDRNTLDKNLADKFITTVLERNQHVGAYLSSNGYLKKSLFTGYTGLGYSALRICKEGALSDESIFLPNVYTGSPLSTDCHIGCLAASKEMTLERIFRNQFPKTTCILNTSIPQGKQYTQYFAQKFSSFPQFPSSSEIHKLFPTNTYLVETLEFEKNLLKLAHTIESRYHFRIKERITIEQNTRLLLNERRLKNAYFSPVDYCFLTKMRWNIKKEFVIPDGNQTEWYFMALFRSSDIAIIELSPEVYSIINSLQKPHKYTQLTGSLMSHKQGARHKQIELLNTLIGMGAFREGKK